MKRQFIIFSLSALTLCACGGGTSTQQQNNTTVDSAANKTATTPQAEQPVEKIPFAAEIAKSIGEEFYGALNATLGAKNDDWKYQEHISYEGMRLDCFPLKSGGYFVIKTDMIMDNCEYETYGSYVYSKSEIKPNNVLLPCPKINDYYSNADKFPEAARKELEEKILTKTRYYYDSGALTVTFDPHCCNEDNPEIRLAEPILGLAAKEGQRVPVISYTWDGEKFVRNPENKPLEEDIAYFEGCEKISVREIWNKIIEYSREEDMGLCADCWTIEYHDDAQIPYFEQLSSKGANLGELYCFQVKDGYKIYYIDNTTDDGFFLYTFEYKDGKISMLDDEFSLEEYKEFWFIDDGKKFRAWKKTDGFDDYVWNGKTLVKE
ncbi:MAG: hypothetical protein II956_16155 [Bacteroidales bacterium]|nr:hypothetical protein [Bacteroidales bacterium]